MTMKNYYLVTTDHKEDGLWFLDEMDFATGMNYVAVQASLSEVVVLSFILMSNHLHFVLYGEEQEVRDFVDGIKSRYGKYYRKKYGVKEFLRRNKVDIRLLPSSEESREKAIAYVHMNCVAANICSYPTQYPWGTGNVFFNPAGPFGKRLGDMSKRSLSRLLHTRIIDLPLDWRVCEKGYVLPESYVDIEAVEKLFRTPRRMNFFLTVSSKAKRLLEPSESNRPSFRDQLILDALPDLCQSLFRKSRFKDLSREDQVEILRQLQFRFCANVHQIARVCGLSYEVAAKMLDSL